MNSAAVELAKEHLEDFANRVQKIRDSLHSVVVGQDETVDQLLICALTRLDALGHYRLRVAWSGG